jgi:phosphoglycerate dehydrogenase-like enzyme
MGAGVSVDAVPLPSGVLWCGLDLGAPWQARLIDAARAAGWEVLMPPQHAHPPLQTVVAWLPGDPPLEIYALPKLRWIHGGHAGLERGLRPGCLRPGLALTSAAGRSAQALAEHAVYLMMDLAYAGERLRRLRRWHLYAAPDPTQRRALWQRTVGVVGMGHVGQRLVELARALGMRVRAWRRRDLPFPPGVDAGFSAAAGDRFSEFLAPCEFLVLAASLNDHSRQLIDATALAALPRGAFVINIARGGLLDESALLSALDAGHLGGAGLDVFAVEPLPIESRLWRHPRVIMSPHATPRQVDREARHYAILVENLARFQRGDALINALGPADAWQPPVAVQRSLLDRLWRRLSPRLLRLLEPPSRR